MSELELRLLLITAIFNAFISNVGDTKIECALEKIALISSVESCLGVSGDIIVLVLVYIGFRSLGGYNVTVQPVDG